jgi:hypothetical protein
MAQRRLQRGEQRGRQPLCCFLCRPLCPLLCVLLCPPALAQPANDSCATATTISNGFTFVSTIGATTDGPDEPACLASADPRITRDIWFRHIATCSGTVTIDFCAADFDSRLAAYSGVCPTGADQAIACDDDGCGLASRMAFSVSAGAAYLLRIGGFGDATGGGTLLISCPPDNDDCQNAIGLCAAPPTFTATLTGATNDGSSDCGLAFGTVDVWYSYTAPVDTTFNVTTCGTNDLGGIDFGIDTVLSLHSGCPGTIDNQIDCSDDTPSCDGAAGLRVDSTIAHFLPAGQTVWIRVTHFGESFPGPFILNTVPVAGNDRCETPSPPSTATLPSAPAARTQTDPPIAPPSATCGSSTRPRAAAS